MAIVNTLQKAVNLSSIFVGGAPLSAIIGVANEPALSIGDWVRQFILSPPFAWSWNRATTTVTVALADQDKTKAIADWGWLEKATYDNGTDPIQELEIVLSIGETRVQEQVRQICPFKNDNAGNITFRLFPAVPDTNGATINLTYQKAAPSFAALTDLWTPIPDYFFYMYQQGMLAKALEYRSDPRYVPAMQLFLRQVVAGAEGLNETQRNIFLTDFFNTQRQAMAAQRGGQA